MTERAKEGAAAGSSRARGREPAELVFEGEDGKVCRFEIDPATKTIWAQAEIADLFGCERSVVTKHINRILADGELVKDLVRAKIAHTATDGKRYNIWIYNLKMLSR
jgi:hypothetical protein